MQALPLSPNPDNSINCSPDIRDRAELRILQWNAQSINNKVDEFRLLLSEERIYIACISETRPGGHETVSRQKFAQDEYQSHDLGARIQDSEKWKVMFSSENAGNFFPYARFIVC